MVRVLCVGDSTRPKSRNIKYERVCVPRLSRYLSQYTLSKRKCIHYKKTYVEKKGNDNTKTLYKYNHKYLDKVGKIDLH